MRPAEAAKIQIRINEFNANFKKGDEIKLLDDSGYIFIATVTYGAAFLGGISPVIYIEGNKGCYDFRRLVKTTPPKRDKLIVEDSSLKLIKI